MSNFVSALIKQRRDAKKAEPSTNGRLREIIAVLIGSAILCTTSLMSGEDVKAFTIAFRAIGIVGFVVGLFFGQRLIREMKKDK